MTYISFSLKQRDMKFGMHVVKTLLYFMKPTDYTYCQIPFLIFTRFMRVCSALSRSELEPFLCIWYHTLRTQNPR